MNQLPLTLFPFDDCCAYVYFFQAGDFIKIGHSETLKKRRSGIQTGNPFDLKLVKLFKFDDIDDAIQAEKDFHEYFKNSWVRGEWFRITPSQIPEFIPRPMTADLFALMVDLSRLVIQARKDLAQIRRIKNRFGIEMNPYSTAICESLAGLSYSSDYWQQVRLFIREEITIDAINESLIKLNG